MSDIAIAGNGCRFGGFGIATGTWLAAEGARRLLTVGRSGAATPAAHRQLAGPRTAGVTVLEDRADIADTEAIGRLPARASRVLRGEEARS